MPRLTEFKEPFDAYDYLPDNKRDPVMEPLYPLIGLLLNHAMDQGKISDTIRLPPFLEQVMKDYTDKEAVLAYYNTGINQRFGMLNAVDRVFALTGLNLGITEWFNNSYPILPFKFFVEIYEFPTVPFTEVINLIYKTKNERSHLVSFRHPNSSVCPPYFILDLSLLSSHHYLSSALGDIYHGVKICWVDAHWMITPVILANEWGHVSIPPAVSYFPAINKPQMLPVGPDWYTTPPTAPWHWGLDISLLQQAAVTTAPVIQQRPVDGYETVESYHYDIDEAQYAIAAQDPYGVRSGGTMTTTPQMWGIYEPTLDSILDATPNTGRDVVPNDWGLAAADLIRELKLYQLPASAGSIWENLDLFYLLDAPTEAIARIDLRRYPEHPLVNSTANITGQNPTHIPLRGVRGSGGGHWEVPSYDPNVTALNLKAKNNIHSMGIWIDEFSPWQASITKNDLMGLGGVMRRSVTTSYQYLFGSQTLTPTPGTPTEPATGDTTIVLPPCGLFHAGRSTGTNAIGAINEQIVPATQNAGALTGNFRVLGQLDEWSQNTISIAYAGAYFDAAAIAQIVASCKKYRDRVASLLYAT